MKVEELTSEHLRAIELREIERAEHGDNISQERVEYFLSCQYKKALVTSEGKVIMAIGGYITGKWAHVWILASEGINENPVAVMETIIRMHSESKAHGVDYLYTYNLPEFPKAIKFLKRLGYYETGHKSDFTDNKTRVVLVKET